MADKAILRSNTYIVGAGSPGDVDIHSNDGSINVTKESKSAFNIEVANQARNEWGKITGDIYKQTDLQELVGTKQDKLTQGSGIIISPENVISANIDLSEYAKKSEIPNSYDKSETYTKNEVNNITDGKADKGDSYTKSESDAKYALKGDVPTDVYTKTEADEKFATKEEIPDPYTLPVASETVLGGIKVGENLTIDEDGTLNANGGLSEVSWGSITGTLDDQTDLKDVLDGKQPVGDYALKSELPDVSTLIPKTVSGSNANWNWSFSDNPTNMGLKFEGKTAPTGALMGVDTTHASMPGGYIELNAIPGAPTSGKKVVLTPSGIDFTRTDGSTYQPVYTDTIGSTYGVYTDKLTKIDSTAYGYYIDTKKMQMWNGGTADAPLGSVAKISSGSVMVAASGQYETSPIPLSKLEGTGLTVSMHGQSLGASVGLAGVKFTTSAGVTHSLENKQDKLTFATTEQVNALFA